MLAPLAQIAYIIYLTHLPPNPMMPSLNQWVLFSLCMTKVKLQNIPYFQQPGWEKTVNKK